jgi:Flp pilus assembly CpaE family ATPase
MEGRKVKECLEFPAFKSDELSDHARVAAVLKSQTVGDEIRLVAESLGDVQFEMCLGSLGQLNGEVRNLEQADVFILEVDANDEADLECFRKLCETSFKDHPVIATCEDVNLATTRALLNAGAVDVLPQPVSQSALLIALEKARHHMPTHRGGGGYNQKGKIISFLKGGGGVGATATVVQMAHVLASRHEEKKICIIDFDLQSGATALYMDLLPKRNMLDLTRYEGKMDGALLRSIMARHESGVHVLAAPPQIVPLETLNSALVETILSIAKQEFDIVLIDLPGVWNEWTNRALQLSDDIVLITETSIYNVNQTKRQLAMLDNQDLSIKPLRLVANRYRKKLFGDIGLDDYKKCLGRDFTDTIPNDYDLVSKALNAGLPVSQFNRNSKYEQAIYHLGQQCALSEADVHVA